MPLSINGNSISTNNLAMLMRGDIDGAKNISFSRSVWNSIKEFFGGATYATKDKLQTSIDNIIKPCNGDNGFPVRTVADKMKLFKSIVCHVDEKEKARFFCGIERNNQVQSGGIIHFVQKT